jgi:ABC-type uncharacterized transport system permease subunit
MKPIVVTTIILRFIAILLAWFAVSTLASLQSAHAEYSLKLTFQKIEKALKETPKPEREIDLPSKFPNVIWVGYGIVAVVFAGCAICMWRFAIPIGKQILKGTEDLS